MLPRSTRRAPARCALLCLFVLAFAFLSGAAGADGTADEAELQFEIGAEAYQKGDFRGALEHFLQSNRLVPNRNVVFNIARTYEQLKRYADAHRYYVDALEGETDVKTVAEIRAALARIGGSVAVLKVETTPPAATLFIDRRELGSRGRSPRPLALPQGRYRVIATLEGYDPVESDLVDAKLGTETTVSLTLRRVVGNVHVDVEGAKHATVHLDDEKGPIACIAPCDLELAPGPHILYFSGEGVQGPPRQVIVTARTTVRAVARMTNLVGSLSVTADERDARIEIDGRSAGFTPAVIPNVAVGTRRVRVVLPGYVPVEQNVVIAPNEQTALDDLKLVPLRQIVAVSRLVEDVDDAPSSLTIIDAQELRAFGYPTIAEALRGVRGVTISTDRAYYSANIRGIGEPNDYGNRLLVLSDGAVLNDNLLNSSYIGSDGRSDLHDVERIEVVRGPGSLLYGTGAFSGVVNLVTRPVESPTSVNAGFGTYDNAVARGRAGFTYAFNKKAGVWASVSGSRSGGQDLELDPNGPRPPVTVHRVDEFNAVGTAGRAWYGPLTAQWFFHRREQHIPVGVYATLVGNSGTTFTDERALGEVRYEPKLSNTVQLFARAHVNHYDFGGHYNYGPVTAITTSVEDYYGSWGGVEARLVIAPTEKFRLIVGGEAQHAPQADLLGGAPDTDGKLHIERCEKPPSEQTAADKAYCDGVYLDVRSQYSFGAAYAIADIVPAPWVRLSGGARVDVYTSFGAVVVPRGAAIFKPVKGGVLKVIGGRAFRAPSVYERFYNDGGLSQLPAVDPKKGLTLGPESIVSGEVEYSQRFAENWVALGAVHASHVDGIINSIPCVERPDSCIRYANSTSPAVLAGGEVELRREWRQGWMLSGYYGYQWAQYIDYHPAPSAGVNPNDPRLVNSPEHLASIKGVAPIVPDVASLGVRGTLEAPRRITASDAKLDPADRTTGTAVVADVTLSGRAKRFGVSYVLGVYNLFDWRYAVPAGETAAARTILQNGRTFLLDVLVEYP